MLDVALCLLAARARVLVIPFGQRVGAPRGGPLAAGRRRGAAEGEHQRRYGSGENHYAQRTESCWHEQPPESRFPPVKLASWLARRRDGKLTRASAGSRRRDQTGSLFAFRLHFL